MILLWTTNQCSKYSGDRHVLQQSIAHVADLIQFPFDQSQILPAKPGTSLAFLHSCPCHLIQVWTLQS